MVSAKLFVEGGGDTNELRSMCRRGFSNFLSKAGLEGSMPRIVACGGREAAFDAFCVALKNGENAFLLVDSEEPVKNVHQNGPFEQWRPWDHLGDRDGWEKPQRADQTMCHLMTQCMETWLIADGDALQSYFNQGFNARALPTSGNPLEGVAKSGVYAALRSATSSCGKNYAKGVLSFEILKAVDPRVVISKCPWAQRFIEILKEKLKP